MSPYNDLFDNVSKILFNVSFEDLNVNNRNSLREGVVHVIDLLSQGREPNNEEIMLTFVMSFENAPNDISNWPEDYKKEIQLVAEEIKNYFDFKNADLTMFFPEKHDDRRER